MFFFVWKILPFNCLRPSSYLQLYMMKVFGNGSRTLWCSAKTCQVQFEFCFFFQCQTLDLVGHIRHSALIFKNYCINFSRIHPSRHIQRVDKIQTRQLCRIRYGVVTRSIFHISEFQERSQSSNILQGVNKSSP